MTSEEIDMLLNKAILQSIELGEDVVRYRFAALVAAAEREACAKLAGPHLNGEIAAAIRARGENTGESNDNRQL